MRLAIDNERLLSSFKFDADTGDFLIDVPLLHEGTPTVCKHFDHNEFVPDALTRRTISDNDIRLGDRVLLRNESARQTVDARTERHDTHRKRRCPAVVVADASARHDDVVDDVGRRRSVASDHRHWCRGARRHADRRRRSPLLSQGAQIRSCVRDEQTNGTACVGVVGTILY